MKCDQCEMLSINGMPCHERGCPNTGSRYDADTQEWARQCECRECGCTVDCDARGRYECTCFDTPEAGDYADTEVQEYRQ